MAGRLHVRAIKFVPAGGDLDAASPLNVTNDQITLDMEEILVEHIITTNPNPKDRHGIGTKYNAKATLEYADDTVLVQLMGGTYSGGIYIKQQEIRTLPNRDVRFEVYRTDNEIVNYDFYDVHFIPKTTFGFSQGKRTYLPFEIMGTSTTEFRVDNAPA